MTHASYSTTVATAHEEKTDYGVIPIHTIQTGPASVTVAVGYGLEFGKGKCSVSITLRCAQDEQTIDQAADMALHKADQLAALGMDTVLERLRDD